MMSQNIKMNFVECSDSGIFSSGAPLMEAMVLSANSEYTVFPGFCDVHVHFREPGFSYKETIVTGSKASAAGGYTAVCTMPNLNPVPDSRENLNQHPADLRTAAVTDVLCRRFGFRCRERYKAHAAAEAD